MELLKKADAENILLEVIIIEILAEARKADVPTQGESDQKGGEPTVHARVEGDQE